MRKGRAVQDQGGEIQDGHSIEEWESDNGGEAKGKGSVPIDVVDGISFVLGKGGRATRRGRRLRDASAEMSIEHGTGC